MMPPDFMAMAMGGMGGGPMMPPRPRPPPGPPPPGPGPADKMASPDQDGMSYSSLKFRGVHSHALPWDGS